LGEETPPFKKKHLGVFGVLNRGERRICRKTTCMGRRSPASDREFIGAASRKAKKARKWGRFLRVTLGKTYIFREGCGPEFEVGASCHVGGSVRRFCLRGKSLKTVWVRGTVACFRSRLRHVIARGEKSHQLESLSRGDLWGMVRRGRLGNFLSFIGLETSLGDE